MVRSHIVDCGPARDNVVVLKSIAKDGFVYSEGCALVQSIVKEVLVALPELTASDPIREYTVTTDASEFGVDVCLSQIAEDA
ncbi:hypothetical protein HPB47_017406 [Ixodes persulcatus]|uniref:Uncharacterized protein n=1 Tax=Ixodes persulcatus TaxID=34615 RepID=A0AC60QNF6_IXOPE|nr:hypothetical protein HPB47_017406 [Ixodes persulcatus]